MKVLKYSIKDLLRSRWLFIYTGFFLLVTWSLLHFTHDTSRSIISLLNIVLLLVPLICLVFGTLHLFNSREFTELLLALPVSRNRVFMGQYLGLVGSLSVSYLIGVGVPFALFAAGGSDDSGILFTMLLSGLGLTWVFTSLAALIAVAWENRVKGFGVAILIWLVLAIIYDGLLMMALLQFSDYPLEKPAIFATIANPIDLARVLVILKMDESAMMGYTGAVFSKYFGSTQGMALSAGALALWVGVPLLVYMRKGRRKDY